MYFPPTIRPILDSPFSLYCAEREVASDVFTGSFVLLFLRDNCVTGVGAADTEAPRGVVGLLFCGVKTEFALDAAREDGLDGGDLKDFP